MKRGDCTGAVALLALSGAALLAGSRVPRAPLWSVAARVVAPGPAAAVTAGGPADSAWGPAVLRFAWLRAALAGVSDPELRAVLQRALTARAPVRAVAGRLMPLPASHVGGAPVSLYPAVPGATSGVQAGCGVTVGALLAGVVVQAEDRVSYVRLVTDPDCRVAVSLVPGPSATGPDRPVPTGPFVATGRAGTRLLRVCHVPTSVDVRAGDLVVTSGAAGLLPAGLQVGRVVGVDNADADTMWDVEVEPALPADTPSAVAMLIFEARAGAGPGRRSGAAVARAGAQ